MTTAHSMVVGCQPYAPAAFTSRNIPGTHFHYGLSRPQGHGLVGRKYVTEKSSDNRSRDRPTSSAAPKPLRYPRPRKMLNLYVIVGIVIPIWAQLSSRPSYTSVCNYFLKSMAVEHRKKKKCKLLYSRVMVNVLVKILSAVRYQRAFPHS